MIQFACPECGTKKKYPDDRAGDRVACRICGKKSSLPYSDDDGGGDNSVSAAERQKKKKAAQRKAAAKAELFGFVCAGWVVSAVGIFGILFALQRRPLVAGALFTSFPIGWVILLVYFALIGMGMFAAIGRGLALSRETRLEGKAGVQTGIAIILIVVALTVGGLESLGEKGKLPVRERPVVDFGVKPPGNAAPKANPVAPNNDPVAANINPADATDERRRHTEAGSGFSMIPPPGWNAKPGPETDKRTFLGPFVNGYQTHIIFVVDRNTTPTEKFVDVVLAGQKKVHPTLRIASRSAAETTSSLHGTKVVAETTIDGRLFRVTQYFFGQEDQRLTITSTIPATEGAETDVMFEVSAKTVRFNAAPADSPSATAASTANPAEASDDSRRYTDAGSGVSLIPPPGWKANFAPGETERKFVGPISNGFQRNLVVVDDQLNGPLEAFVEDTLKLESTQSPGLRVISQAAFETASSLRGFKVIMESPNGGRPLRITQYFFARQNRFVAITIATSTGDGLEETGKIFDDFAKTVRLNAAAATPQPKTSDPSTQVPRNQPPGTNNFRQVSTTVVGYAGTNDIVDEAKKALASVTAVDPQSIEYEKSTATLSMRVSGNTTSTRPIMEALGKAGIKTQGVSVRPVHK